MDFSAFSMHELRTLENKLVLEIKKRQQEDLMRARQAVLAIAQQVGIPLQDLLGTPAQRKRTGPQPGTKVKMKFRHPQQPHLTWTGRGRQPIWLQQALAEGLTWAQLAINQLPA